MSVRRFALVLLLLLCAVPAGTASAGPPLGGFLEGNNDGRTTYLSRCSLLHGQQTIWNCYVTRLLADVEKSGDPAHELPRIDVKVRAGGGYLESACHMMMHEVGRKFARRHHVTLANLQRYLPRSNDPGCSAGFGMGMVLTLGPQIGQLGPQGAIKLCMQAPTRYRSYTCVHTLGHAYMRLYHEQLPFAVQACRALPVLQAPDCAQGAYHDYWLSLAGRDATTKQKHGIRSARVLCGRAIAMFAPRLTPDMARRNSFSAAGSAYSAPNRSSPALISFCGSPVFSAGVSSLQYLNRRRFAISRMPPM
jgi:hypothetical protein